MSRRHGRGRAWRGPPACEPGSGATSPSGGHTRLVEALRAVLAGVPEPVVERATRVLLAAYRAGRADGGIEVANLVADLDDRARLRHAADGWRHEPTAGQGDPGTGAPARLRPAPPPPF